MNTDTLNAAVAAIQTAELRKFVLEVSPGGCNMASEGTNCICPLCRIAQLERVIDKMSSEATVLRECLQRQTQAVQFADFHDAMDWVNERFTTKQTVAMIQAALILQQAGFEVKDFCDINYEGAGEDKDEHADSSVHADQGG